MNYQRSNHKRERSDSVISLLFTWSVRSDHINTSKTLCCITFLLQSFYTRQREETYKSIYIYPHDDTHTDLHKGQIQSHKVIRNSCFVCAVSVGGPSGQTGRCHPCPQEPRGGPPGRCARWHPRPAVPQPPRPTGTSVLRQLPAAYMPHAHHG